MATTIKSSQKKNLHSKYLEKFVIWQKRRHFFLIFNSLGTRSVFLYREDPCPFSKLQPNTPNKDTTKLWERGSDPFRPLLDPPLNYIVQIFYRIHATLNHATTYNVWPNNICMSCWRICSVSMFAVTQKKFLLDDKLFLVYNMYVWSVLYIRFWCICSASMVCCKHRTNVLYDIWDSLWIKP